MKIITLATLSIGLLVFCGCANLNTATFSDMTPRVGPKSEFVPPGGILFSSYKAPLLVTFDNAAISKRDGEASASYFHDPIITGLDFAWDKCSLNAAVNDGGFNRVGSADYSYFNILGIYAKTTVHVYEDSEK